MGSSGSEKIVHVLSTSSDSRSYLEFGKVSASKSSLLAKKTYYAMTLNEHIRYAKKIKIADSTKRFPQQRTIKKNHAQYNTDCGEKLNKRANTSENSK